jgi:uncharacterized protein
MGYAVNHFFTNGGSQAIVVRALPTTALRASLAMTAVDGVTVSVKADSPGASENGVPDGGGNPRDGLWVQKKASTRNPADGFALVVSEWSGGSLIRQEIWDDLSLSTHNSRYAPTVLAASELVTLEVAGAPGGPLTPGSSRGSVALTAPIPHIVGTVLRVSLNQGPAQDYTLFAGAVDTAQNPDDVAAEIKDRVGAANVDVAVDGATHEMVITSLDTSVDSAVTVGLSGATDASIPLGLGLGMHGSEVSGSAQLRPADIPATKLDGGTDGGDVDANAILNAMQSLNALQFPRFNLLCLPGVPATAANAGYLGSAIDYCRQQRAFLLVDPPPGVNTESDLSDAVVGVRAQGAHGAFYWPRLVTADSGPGGLPPCGAVAGVMARTDAERGVWKAPAGSGAGIGGVIGTVYPTDDDVSGQLNPAGLNVLRSFPNTGLVIWGARTLAGADGASSADFKYVPVRRLTDYIASSLYLGTQFAVFEPNDPVLWGQLRLAVGAFMRSLFRQGAFQQSEKRAESDSFYVICDSTVNPQSEIDAGRVNIVVAFAPLKPAEFVIVTITQLSQGGA